MHIHIATLPVGIHIIHYSHLKGLATLPGSSSITLSASRHTLFLSGFGYGLKSISKAFN